ncbi:hypothetical protein Tco_0277438 [Tanacetum coccineum]
MCRTQCQLQGLGTHDMLNSQIICSLTLPLVATATQSKLLTISKAGHHLSQYLENLGLHNVYQDYDRLLWAIVGPGCLAAAVAELSNLTTRSRSSRGIVCGGRIRGDKKNGGSGGVGASSSAGTKSSGCSGSGMDTRYMILPAPGIRYISGGTWLPAQQCRQLSYGSSDGILKMCLRVNIDNVYGSDRIKMNDYCASRV